MFDKEKQKYNFKNHIATLTDLGNIKILDFKNPNSNEYRIRFLFEEDYCRLHISGDLGELIATNYYNMTYEKFSDFVHDVGYFETKIDCCSRKIDFYDEDYTREQIIEKLNDYGVLTDVLDHARYDKLEEFFEDVFIDFSEDTGIGPWGRETLGKYFLDIDSLLDNIDKKNTGILDLYMLAFELAQEQLKEQEKNLNTDKEDMEYGID